MKLKKWKNRFQKYDFEKFEKLKKCLSKFQKMVLKI
jgi:hypothetical protein